MRARLCAQPGPAGQRPSTGRAGRRRGAWVVTEPWLLSGVQKDMTEGPAGTGCCQLHRVLRGLELDGRRATEKGDQLQKIGAGREEHAVAERTRGVDQADLLQGRGDAFGRNPESGVLRVQQQFVCRHEDPG